MSDSPLWSWSVHAWGLPGAEPLLLELQDKVGADINLLLAACWLASEHRCLTAEMAMAAQKQVQPWRRNCIEPLRAVRRYLGELGQQGDLRDSVKALELQAEHVQQAALYALLKQSPEASPGIASSALAEQNLQTYCNIAAGFSWKDAAESLLLLVRLVEPGTTCHQ